MYLPARLRSKPTWPRSTRCSRADPLHHPGHRRRRRAHASATCRCCTGATATRIELRGHWARAESAVRARRPRARDRARPARLRVAGLVSGQGSRGARADLELRRRAPARRRSRRFDDEASLARSVDDLSAQHRSAASASDWRYEPSDDDHRVAAARHRRLPPARRARRAEVQAQPEPPRREPRRGDRATRARRTREATPRRRRTDARRADSPTHAGD